MIIETIFKIFIPNDLRKDALTFSYAKNIVGACIISIIAAPAYSVLYYWLNDTEGALVIILVEILLLSALLIVKFVQSLYLANLVFTSSVIAILCWLIYHLGGLYSATSFWLILPPLIAAFIGGMRAGYFWCLISIIAATIFYFMQSTGYSFPASPISDPLLLHYIALCGLTLVIIGLVYFYEIGKKDSLDKLKYLAYHDTLTGLPNRIAYDELLIKAIRGAEKTQNSFSIIYIDVDHFNKINSIFDLNVGDLMLKQIAHRIQRFAPDINNIARVGGDEFKVIIENNGDGDSDTTRNIVDIITMSLKTPFYINKQEILITTSIGVAVYDATMLDISFVNRYADIALAKAKELGGNNVQFFTDKLAREKLLEIEIENQLSTAILDNELFLNYQLQFSTHNPAKITGMEALLRWNNKKLGIVSPELFIPAAERVGIISQFGNWILKEACQQYMQWYRVGLTDDSVSLAVNISIHQLYQENFLTFLEEVLNESGIPPNNLELELTETTVITDLSHAITILEKINKIGVKTVIDDFGSGYTSLNYLDMLPVSRLKIDKSLIQNMLKMNSRLIIIASIIELAHKINLQVVAEGVETIEQLACLRKINCDYVQGYYLSRPLDSAYVEAFLAATKRPAQK